MPTAKRTIRPRVKDFDNSNPTNFGGPANVFSEESPLSVREGDRRGRRSSPFRGVLGHAPNNLKFGAPKIATLDAFKKKVR